MSEHRTVVAGEAKQVKSGTAKTGRPYTLIALHDGSGKQVGTCFGGSDPHKAWEASKGCTVDVELEENGEYNGQKRFNVVAVEVHREPVVAPVAAPQGNGRAMPLDDAMRMSRCCGLQYSAIAHAQRDTSEDDIMAFARRMAEYAFTGKDPGKKGQAKQAAKEPEPSDEPSDDPPDPGDAYEPPAPAGGRTPADDLPFA